MPSHGVAKRHGTTRHKGQYPAKAPKSIHGGRVIRLQADDREDTQKARPGNYPYKLDRECPVRLIIRVVVVVAHLLLRNLWLDSHGNPSNTIGKDFTDTLAHLLDDVRGVPDAEMVGRLDALHEAGYTVEVFQVQGERVCRATDLATGEREQVRTVAGAVTGWTATGGGGRLANIR